MNLTDKTIEIIKATVPLFKEGVIELNKTVYPMIFSRYPALKSIFNQTHMRDRTQPRALSASVIDYANAIDNLDAIKPLVNNIAEKHASFEIKPVQYKIISTCLLEVIGNLLGDAATPEVEKAWKDDVVTLTSDHDNFTHHFFCSRDSVKSADTKEGKNDYEFGQRDYRP